MTIVNNDQFYSDMNIVDFVTDVGRHFRMGTMLGRHSVKSRKEITLFVTSIVFEMTLNIGH